MKKTNAQTATVKVSSIVARPNTPALTLKADVICASEHAIGAKAKGKMTNNTDYTLTDKEADTLAGCAVLPTELRTEILSHYVEQHGPDALVTLFAQFIGLANSVVLNSREMIEIILIAEGNMHPHTAERANLPTISGGIAGAKLANKVPQNHKKMCAGCAFQRGTAANQSIITTLDAEQCLSEGESPFMCHDDMTERGEPTKACAGYAMAFSTTRNRA